MPDPRLETIHYKRSHFVTQLPVSYRYSRSHAWISAQGEKRWRVGLTKFATRMLGEMVDHGFESQPGTAVAVGQIIGWVEGFKAISDLFAVVRGEFIGSNPALKDQINLIGKDPYAKGWLYEIDGEPDPQAVDVQAYRVLLDKTIDRILEKQQGEKSD